MIPLEYRVFALPENRYFLKLLSEGNLLDELESIGITCEKEVFFSTLGAKLQQILADGWEEDTLPYFRLEYVGFPNVEELPTYLYIYFRHKGTTDELTCELYREQALIDPLAKKVMLYVGATEVITSKDFIKNWFKRPVLPNNNIRPLLTTVHKSWYPDEKLRNTLMEMGLLAIEHFLVAKELDLYVPAYSVVPVYHVRHMQRAYQILTRQHKPVFIMSLPIHKNNIFAPYYAKANIPAKNQYTVIFPITKDLNKK